MKPSYPMICALATFIIMFDHHKLVAAHPAYEVISAKNGGKSSNSVLESENISYRDANNADELIKCVVGTQTCTDEGEKFKLLLIKLFQTQCDDCTIEEKQHVGKVLSHALLYYTEDWKSILERYDEDNYYHKHHDIDDSKDGMVEEQSNM